MRALFVIILLTALVLPTVAFAEIQTFTATHTYILGDHDSKDEARQRCLLEAKRNILEQAGVYIESASEVKNFDLTKDKITSFAAAVMQVKDTKEDVSFQQEHMTMTLKLTAQVDLAEVRKQLAARQLDAGVRDTVTTQQERLKYLEAQLEAMQQALGRVPASPSSNISPAFVQTLRTRAAQGDAEAQTNLGLLYYNGQGVPQDYVQAAKWLEKAAVEGFAGAQVAFGLLYDEGKGVPQDYTRARQWYEKAAAQGNVWAQGMLGLLYYEGRGISKDDTQARQWTEKAAAQGNAAAQGMLGFLYARGQGVSQNNVMAYMWYSLAAPQMTGEDQKSAANSREAVARRMTPAQIAEGQRLAQQCQSRQFKGC